MTVISEDESKVFYGVKKTTRVATIAEAHEAIKGSRNLVNVVVLSPNASDSSNQNSDTEEVPAESIEETYEPAGELEMKKILKVTRKLKCLCQHVPKEEHKNCPNGKKSLVLKELYKGKN